MVSMGPINSALSLAHAGVVCYTIHVSKGERGNDMTAYTHNQYHKQDGQPSDFELVGNVSCTLGGVRRVRKCYRLASGKNDALYYQPKGRPWLVQVEA